MQEDIVGSLRAIGHDAATCSLCGAPCSADELAPLDAVSTHGVRSEHEAVCPACRRALAEGDDPAFPLDEDSDLA
jgi:hypothetical protein